MELFKTRRWEISASRRSALIMACSEQDHWEIDRLTPGTTVSVVPNVIDVREYEPGPTVSNHTVVFVAYFGWYPNQDGVEFFVSSVLPRLRSLVPDVKFVAAGRNPPDDFRRRLSKVPGVEFTGTVPDIRPVIADAAVCVVPLRIATGTRLKILEAAAMEKAVVSTTIGAEGLDFKNGSEIVIADDPEVLACEIAALLASPSRTHAIGAAARRRVQECYGIEAVRTALRRTVAQIENGIDKRVGTRAQGHSVAARGISEKALRDESKSGN
jgi:glycosyltransferase involved in cell wall biosynthesis